MIPLLRYRTALVCVFCFLWVNGLHATPRDIFSSGIQSHGSLYQISHYQVNRGDVTGSVRIGGLSRYVSSNGEILAQNVFLDETRNHSICGDHTCNPLAGSTPKLVLPEFPFRDVASSGGYLDTYKEKVIQGRRAAYFETLEMEAGSKLYLEPGDYWIRNAAFGDGSSIVVNSDQGAGTVRVFVLNALVLGSSVNWNAGGDPGTFLLYSRQDIQFNNGSVNGYIYGENEMDIFGASSIVGAINARHIAINDGSELIEDLTGLESLEWQGFGLDFSIDREQASDIQNACPGYSGMVELPSVEEDSNCTATNDPAELLSETGCFHLKKDVWGDAYIDPDGEIDFAPGVIPYVINSPLWSDGAKKSRGMVLPKGSKITIHDNGDWEFPLGSILIKNFEIYGKRVETRFLMRVDDGTFDREGRPVGSWYGYSYEWNEEGNDATLLTGADARNGKDRWVNGQPYSEEIWRYPGQDHCFACHSGYVKHDSDRSGKTYYKGMINVTNNNIRSLFGDWFSWLLDFWWKVVLRADYPDMNTKASGEFARLASLGPETAQLNLSCTDPDTGIQLNQFDALKNAGAFQYASTVTTEEQIDALDQMKIVNPYDSKAAIEERARSYLYVNCSSCHHGTLDGYGPGDANYDFRVNFDDANLLGPNSFFIKDWRFGVKDNLLVFPGAPESSIISIRLHYENGGSYPDYGSFVRMPFKSTTKPDHHGIAVIDAWIKSGLGFSQFEDIDADGYAECLLPGIAQDCLLDDPDRLGGDASVNFHRVFGF